MSEYNDLLLEQESHKQALEQLDSEIEDLMAKVRQLQFKKSQHQRRIKYYQGLMTLARRLPPEILAGIIEECVRDGWTRTPLTALHVCSEWRKASKIPTLWSHVYVNLDAKDPCGRTRFWLENAGTSFLYITLEIKNDTMHLSDIMRLLLDRIPQWRMFTINSLCLIHLDYIFSLCNRPTPGLRALHLSVLESANQQADANGYHLPNLSHAFPEGPQFRTLRISHDVFPLQGTIPPTITNLSITLPLLSSHMTALSIDTALDLLGDLPALQHCSISLTHGQERAFQSVSDLHRLVILPDLQNLVLNGSRDIFKILPHLSTPKLNSLHLRSSLNPLGYPEAQTGSHIVAFIQHSSPPLHLLELHDIDLLSTDFVTCFAALPTLRDLHLHESDITDAVIHRLYGSDVLCPMLSNLDLRWCGQVTGRTLTELVRARLEHRRDSPDAEPISSITIINCSFVTEQDIMDLSELIVCCVVMRSKDYCQPFGCCQNERYRKRLHLRHPRSAGNVLARRRLIA